MKATNIGKALVVAIATAVTLGASASASAQAWGEQLCYSPFYNYTFDYGYGPLASPGAGCYFFMPGVYGRVYGYVVW